MNEFISQVMDYRGLPVLIAVFLILFIAERKRQLRKRVQRRWYRIVINSIISVPGFAALRFLFIPAVVWIAYKNQSWQIGLNYLYHLPVWTESVIAVLLLDYTNYVWHVLLHRWPLLWRFHLVHHTDLDLDVTTAVRFHFGELIASVFFRGAAVLLIGITPLMVIVYEIIFEAATQFHHSNWRLPAKVEKYLNKVLVTPRMHGIHHSIIKNETDSNFSVIFSFWDRWHRTIKLHIPQDRIIIGTPSYYKADELTVGFLLKLPFTRIRKWENRFLQRNSEE